MRATTPAPVLAALLSLSLAPSARAELPPLSEQELLAQATHVVVGRVEASYSAERARGEGHVDTAFVGEITVGRLEKGSGPTEGQRLYARWWRASKRPAGWVGPGGMTVALPVGSTVRLYLARDASGAYDVLRPNGATVLEGAPSSKIPAAHADTPESLRAEFSRLLDVARGSDRAKTRAAIADWLLPDAKGWIPAVFGPDHGAKGAAEYARMTSEEGLLELAEFLGTMAEEARTDPVQAIPLEAKESDSPAGRLISRMVSPTRLWSVRTAGKSLSFLVFVDGRWRIAGKMRAVREN